MIEYVVLTLVVIITIAAHVWMYKWLRFKMDEGVILRHLRDADPARDSTNCDTQAIAQRLELGARRVVDVCERSKEITRAEGSDCWRPTDLP